MCICAGLFHLGVVSLLGVGTYRHSPDPETTRVNEMHSVLECVHFCLCSICDHLTSLRPNIGVWNESFIKRSALAASPAMRGSTGMILFRQLYSATSNHTLSINSDHGFPKERASLARKARNESAQARQNGLRKQAKSGPLFQNRAGI
jgi:hypothetical protein